MASLVWSAERSCCAILASSQITNAVLNSQRNMRPSNGAECSAAAAAAKGEGEGASPEDAAAAASAAVEAEPAEAVADSGGEEPAEAVDADDAAAAECA